MGKLTMILISLFLITSCDKNPNFTRNNKDKAIFIKNNTFIKSPGIYYFRDVSIIIKEFKDDTIVYGIFDYNNNLLYQRNINTSISNYMKWTIYIDKQGQIWFYNADYQETSIFIIEGKNGLI